MAATSTPADRPGHEVGRTGSPGWPPRSPRHRAEYRRAALGFVGHPRRGLVVALRHRCSRQHRVRKRFEDPCRSTGRGDRRARRGECRPRARDGNNRWRSGIGSIARPPVPNLRRPGGPTSPSASISVTHESRSFGCRVIEADRSALRRGTGTDLGRHRPQKDGGRHLIPDRPGRRRSRFRLGQLAAPCQPVVELLNQRTARARVRSANRRFRALAGRHGQGLAGDRRVADHDRHPRFQERPPGEWVVLDVPDVAPFRPFVETHRDHADPVGPRRVNQKRRGDVGRRPQNDDFEPIGGGVPSGLIDQEVDSRIRSRRLRVDQREARTGQNRRPRPGAAVGRANPGRPAPPPRPPARGAMANGS